MNELVVSPSCFVSYFLYMLMNELVVSPIFFCICLEKCYCFLWIYTELPNIIGEFKILALLHVNAVPEMAEKSGDSLLSKLRALYVQAKDLSENESKYVYLLIMSRTMMIWLHYVYWYFLWWIGITVSWYFCCLCMIRVPIDCSFEYLISIELPSRDRLFRNMNHPKRYRKAI